MKFFSLLLLMFTAITANAQPRTDSTRLDSSWTASPDLPYLMGILNADVLEGRSIPVDISPTGQKLCFDKKIKLKTITSSGPAEVCVFINTKTGLIGYTPLKRGSAGICDIKPEDPEFRFSVIGLKGNTYNYSNSKKKNTIEHWVQTSNSETYQYQFSAVSAAVPLRKKAERRSYCDGKVKARLYKVDGRPEEWFLFGKTYPEAVLMEPKKFLGNFAVGYQYSDKGLFIIMQMTSGAVDSKILQLEEVNVCFDPAPFKVFEDEQQTKMTASIRSQREKLEKEAVKPEKYAVCESKKATLINFQKEALNRQEANMAKAGQGNMAQNVNTQKAQAELMNYDDVVQTSIYETELKLCRAEAQQAENPSDTRQKKIECLNRQLAAHKSVQVKFIAINNTYRNQPGKQQAEKAKEFMRGLVICD